MCDSGSHPLVGNHFCNDETNNVNCSYDGGDCCSPSINYDYCSNCTCYFLESCAIGSHPLIGDGYCNDETNIEDCSFDGGDCCGSYVSFDLCSECTCYGKCFSKPLSSMYIYKHRVYLLSEFPKEPNQVHTTEPSFLLWSSLRFEVSNNCKSKLKKQISYGRRNF